RVHAEGHARLRRRDKQPLSPRARHAQRAPLAPPAGRHRAHGRALDPDHQHLPGSLPREPDSQLLRVRRRLTHSRGDPLMNTSHLVKLLPAKMQNQVESYFEALEVFLEIRDPRVLMALGPAGVRGLLLKRGKQGTPTRMPAHHAAHFDWSYPADQPEMRELYRRAKQ